MGLQVQLPQLRSRESRGRPRLSAVEMDQEVSGKNNFAGSKNPVKNLGLRALRLRV